MATNPRGALGGSRFRGPVGSAGTVGAAAGVATAGGAALGPATTIAGGTGVGREGVVREGEGGGEGMETSPSTSFTVDSSTLCSTTGSGFCSDTISVWGTTFEIAASSVSILTLGTT